MSATRSKRRQRAILTLTDTGSGRFRLELDFRPAVSPDAQMSPAVAEAMACLGFIVSRHPQSAPDCTEPDRKRCPRRCEDFCNAAVTAPRSATPEDAR